MTNNLFLVDGANNNDIGSNRTILIYPSLESIAEFKLRECLRAGVRTSFRWRHQHCDSRRQQQLARQRLLRGPQTMC